MPPCSHCGYEVPGTGWEICPLCGSRAHAAESARPSSSESHRPEWPEWEDPELSFPGNFIATWRRSVLAPADFFEGVPYGRPALRPILYFLLIGVVSAFFGLWWSSVFSAFQVPFVSEYLKAYGLVPTAAWAIMTFFLAPFTALLGLTISSLTIHLFVLMLARRRRPLLATVRVLSYSASPSVFAVVPLVGWIVGTVWGLVLTVTGLRVAHRMSTGAAVAAVILATLLPGMLLVLLLLSLAMAAFSLGA